MSAKTTCPECKVRTFIAGFGCTSCGLGNPLKGISCGTALASRIQHPIASPAPKGET